MADHVQKPLILHASSLPKIPSSFDDASRGQTTWHTLFSAPATATSSLSGGVATCPPAGSLALHRHQQAEVYYILSGSGEVEIDGAKTRVSKDTVIWIPGNAEHGVFCGPHESLKWFYIFPEGSFDAVVYQFRHETMESPKVVRAKL